MLALWIIDLPHLFRKGHRPNWYDLGPRVRVQIGATVGWSPSRHCLNCAGSGGGKRFRATLFA